MKSEFKIILLLFCLSGLLLGLHSLSFNSILEIDLSGDSFTVQALDDRTTGGSSVSHTYLENGQRILECQLSLKYQYPFCELNIQLTQMIEDNQMVGMDLSKFDRVGIWLTYHAPTDAGLRLHLRNYHQDYSNLSDENSMKYNSVEWFRAQGSTQPIWIPLNTLQVPTWWTSENRISLKDTGPDFHNIVSIELSTGDQASEGLYRMEVDKLEFEGKLVSTEQLYLFLLLVWMSYAFLRLGYTIIKNQQIVAVFKFREQELTSINNLLDSKSRKLAEQVGRDVLTGILNRQGLQTILFDEQGHARQTKVLSIAFIDIDHFKPINDNFGHLVGDEILKEFATFVSENVRSSSEILARWGGEEFILACPNSNLSEATLLAEKIRAKVAAHQWPHDIKLTCSIGVVQMQEETVENFIKRADIALYQAKDQGRNKVISAAK